MKKLKKWLTALLLLRCRGTNTKKEVGARGEKLTARFLQRKGWKIHFRNVRYGQDELDILATDPSGNLVLVEVKTTSSPTGRPERSLTKRKKRALMRLMRRFYHIARVQKCDVRVDLVAVRLGSAEPNFKHYRGVLYTFRGSQKIE